MTSSYLAKPKRSEDDARADADYKRALENKRALDRLERASRNPNPIFAYTDGLPPPADYGESPRDIARQQWQMLVRSLPWDFQNDERKRVFVEFCSKDLGLDEVTAYDVMRFGE